MAKKRNSTTPVDYFKVNTSTMITKFPQLQSVVDKLVQSPQLSHASNILAKAIELKKKPNTEKEAVLNKLIIRYLQYITATEGIATYSKDDLETWAVTLDGYYKFFEDEKIEDTFDSRSKIRSTVLEEFTYLFLRRKVQQIVDSKCGDKKEEIICGATKAYSNLYITGKNLESFVIKPLVKINDKDQDYAIYRRIPIVIPNKDNTKAPIAQVEANVPILAIENKTFLDKTMLEGSVATAEKLKSGNPYSTFIVVTETYAVADDVDPIYSRIDQIFVLRKCKHDSKNRMPNPIAADVLEKLINLVDKRLTGTWSDIGQRMKDGVIM